MTVRDFLRCLEPDSYVELFYSAKSNGVYSVREILNKNMDCLDEIVPENSVYMESGRVNVVLAFDSEKRAEPFYGGLTIFYLCVRLK